eukprot:gb/GEZN01001315.1/.p1 GENE.gb/GEZN01001315.1/~~gb/GEZN01001315.1/.p1  ORF type:complete len:922 (-),score=114.23 gb/GEZN01001315.1/:299-3064(-)
MFTRERGAAERGSTFAKCIFAFLALVLLVQMKLLYMVVTVPHYLDRSLPQDIPLLPSDQLNTGSGDDKNVALRARLPPIHRPSAKLSVLALVFKEYKSLAQSFRTWHAGGLFDYADEIIVLLNGEQRDPSTLGIPFLDLAVVKVINSAKDLLIGEAVIRLVNEARNELVLFLEKDFQLIEPRHVLQARLDDGVRLVTSGVADVVRYRHRTKPGFPMYAQIMGENREHLMFRSQSNLWCFVMHWMPDPVKSHPDKFKWCPSTNLSEPHLCSKPNYCQWTNNPQIYKKQWFLKEIGDVYLKHGLSEGPGSHMRDLEFFSYWNSQLNWNGRDDWTIALGDGLFMHGEMEDHVTNEMVFYANFRRKTDLEDMRRELLTADKQLRVMSLQDQQQFWGKTQQQGGYLRFGQRYPKLCINYTKEKLSYTYEQQIALVEAFDSNTKTGYVQWEQTGEWKRWKDVMKQAGEVANKMLASTVPTDPDAMTITWVTGIFDLGRGNLDAEDTYQFKRDFTMYMDALKKFISYPDYKMVVFTQQWIIDELAPLLTIHQKRQIHWIAMTLDQVKSKLPGDSAALIEQIRTNPKWYSQASWLHQSPQAKLSMYNPLVMSKPFLVADAARLNPHGTTHFLWVDVKHNCLHEGFTPKTDWTIRAHMIDQYLLTYFKYGPAGEVHGFRGDKFNSMLGLPPHNTEPVKVVRGGILGGPRALCIAVELLYKIALRASLKLGYMGTEENILSLVLYTVPDVFAPFSNDEACERELEGDHACKGSRNPGGNCAIFDWVYHGLSPFVADPDYRSEGNKGGPQWGKEFALSERLCLYENENWLVLFSQAECEEEGGKWVGHGRGFPNMGECTDRSGSHSWNERVNCKCFPSACVPSPLLGSTSPDCWNPVPGCLKGTCARFPHPKNTNCGAGGTCDGKGNCVINR